MIKFNEVTWYSKLAAILFFMGVLPLVTFYLGVQYGIVIEQKRALESAVAIVPALPGVKTGTTTIAYEMVASNAPGFTYPQITNYPDTEVMNQVNETLRQAFAVAGCGTPAEAEQEYEWNIVTTVDYAQNDIFSVNASGNYFCGGAYPVNNYSQTLTFDMKTGEQINFADLFVDFETDQSQIIETIYAAQIDLALLSQGVAEEGSCALVNTLDTLLNYTHDFRLSSNVPSIIVRPQYPHVIEACIEPVTVPVEQLLPYAPEDSLLYRL